MGDDILGETVESNRIYTASSSSSSSSPDNNNKTQQKHNMSSSAASNQRLFIDASTTADPQSASTNNTNNNNTSPQQQQQQEGDTPTSARTQNTSLYADDDSAVSSEVTDDGTNSDPEVPILTRMEVVREEEVLPRNRKEWCIVLLAILCILLIAAGVGVGVYFLVRHLTNDNDTDKSVPPPVVVTTSPTGSPTSMPTNGTLPQPMPGLPSDLGGAIQLHVLQQGISNLLSFGEPPDGTTDDIIGTDDNTNEGGSTTKTPQELAIDFLVSKDTLPVEVLDAKNDEGNTDDVFGSTNDKDVLVTRPYITIDTPAYRVAQRYAALVLYYGTNGNEWSSNNRWLEPGVHECDWVGVTCELVEIPSISLKDALVDPTDLPATTDDSNMDVTMERMITSIDLPKNNLQGNIPQELVALPYLERLGLWSNELTGQIPSSIGKLSRLSSILLDDNDLSGSIPHDLGDLNELTTLFLGLNKDINGRIPNSIHNLSKLQKLGLNDLSLSGPIPKKFGQLSNLTWLDLSKNELTNTLPNELSKVTSLQTLLVNDNELSGSIPESYGERLVNLEKLEVHGNDLTGSVDSSLCELTTSGSLETLVATDCNSAEGGGGMNTISCNCCTSCV